MRQLYLARDRIEAQLLRDYLERHLIRTAVFGDYLSGATGELPADICPSVWVIDDSDWARGRDLLAAFLSPDTTATDAAPWTCPVCGEQVDGGFEVCWSCGSPRAA